MSEIQSAPPSVRPPHDPTIERMRVMRGIVIDLAVLAAIVALALTKTVGSDAAVALIAALAGAGAVHKGQSGSNPGGSSKLGASGMTLALLFGVASLLRMRGGGDS